MNNPDHILIELLAYHQFFGLFYPLLFAINLLNLFFTKNYSRMNFRIWLASSATFFLLSISFFSGLVLVFFMREFFSFRIFCMLVFMFIVLILEIYRARRLKFARTKESLFIAYIRFSRVLYLILLILWFILMWILAR